MSSLLADSLSKTHYAFANDEGGRMTLGHFKIIQAVAEMAGASAAPAVAGPLPTPPTLVAVDPAVGSVGLIELNEFDTPVALSLVPTTAPDFHGARGVVLTASADNPSAIYWSQSPYCSPPGGSFTALGPQLLVNPGFAETGGGWTTTEWTLDSGALLVIAETGGANSVPLEQAVTAPAGNYRITAEIATVNGTGGTTSLNVALKIGGTTLTNWDTVGSKTWDFVHAGGAILINLAGEFEGDGGVELLISSAALYRKLTPAGIVGNPLEPGASILLTTRDLDANRGLFIVPTLTVGTGDAKVIVNWLY